MFTLWRRRETSVDSPTELVPDAAKPQVPALAGRHCCPGERQGEPQEREPP
jgi:hypothetical protein